MYRIFYNKIEFCTIYYFGKKVLCCYINNNKIMINYKNKNFWKLFLKSLIFFNIQQNDIKEIYIPIQYSEYERLYNKKHILDI